MKLKAQPASLIPLHAVDILSFNILQKGPLVFHLFPQPAEFHLQGADLLVDGLDFVGIGEGGFLLLQGRDLIKVYTSVSINAIYTGIVSN